MGRQGNVSVHPVAFVYLALTSVLGVFFGWLVVFFPVPGVVSNSYIPERYIANLY